MSVINTNITSMVAQQNLNDSKGALETNMERLSSGLRINSAKDDAAGQAIANRFEAQTTGLGQAQRNANDGISVAQTAEGALDQINDNVQRVRELTVQAQNGTNSEKDLTSIQNEIDERTAEIDRISEQTDFNGVKVLSGEKDSISIQVGANDGESISVNLEKTNSEELNLDSLDVSKLPDTLNAQTLAKASGATGATDISTVTADAEISFSAGANLSASDLQGAKVIEDSSGSLYTQTQDGEFFNLADSSISVDDSGETVTVTVNGSSGNTVDESDVVSKNLGPLDNLDDALNTIDSFRSNLGAVQNRFESAITNLSTNETNLSDAQSRIEDADYASEVADMTKNQILQQAGTSVLAQANQLPQNALSLLG